MQAADVIATPIVWILGATVIRAGTSGLPPEVARWAYLAQFAHLCAGIAQVALYTYYYSGGDMFMYATEAEWLHSLILHDPNGYLPEVIALAFQLDAQLPVRIVGAGSSTGSMAAIAALLYLISGGSLHASIAAIATCSAAGKLALFRVLRERFPGLDGPLAVGIMLLPSVVFWSSGLQKESVVMGPFCLLVSMLIRADGTRSWLTLMSLPLAGLVALIKPYVLFALIPSVAVLFYAKRAAARGRTITIRPIYLALGATLVIAGLVLLGRVFPEYAVETIGEQLGRQQAASLMSQGGSNYVITRGEERTLAGQLAFAPLAIMTALFRPFFFEFHNAVSLLAAAEATVIVLLMLRSLRRLGLRQMAREVLASPTLCFCLAFTLGFGLGVGLGTTNMGTLSRYRIPLLPFWTTLLLVWNRDIWQKAAREGMTRLRPLQRAR